MTKRSAFFFAVAALAAVSLVKAQDDSGNGGRAAVAAVSLAKAASDSGNGGRIVLPAGLTLKPHVYAHFEAGEIESGNLDSWGATNINGADGRYGINHVWTQDPDMEIGFTSIYKEHLKLEASLGAKMAFGYPIIFDGGHVATKASNSFIYFDEAYAQYHFGNAESPWLLGQVGYFKFKYNPDVRNLGEYMFRTGTYPIYFDMTFDAPFARLLGVHLQSNLFDNSLKLDALLSSSTLFPTMNWSLSGLINYDIAALHFISIGAGYDFSDLLDVYTNNAYAKGGDPTTPHNTSVNYQYISSPGDTSNWYTFRGDKVMGRISFAPQAFFKWRFLGENDLRLYAEAVLIGRQNYPDTGYSQGSPNLVAPSYDDWTQKTPVAVGFNFPTYPLIAYGLTPEMLLWKLQGKYDVVPQVATTVGSLVAGAALSLLQEMFHVNSQLDVLNLELEWFGAKYYNDDFNVFAANSNPLPNDVSFWGTPGAPNKSQTKWSLYAKKSFLNGHFALTGQVGLDHTRLSNFSYDNYQLRNELLVTNQDWWWVLKTSWMF
jgi:hypothetical protein